MRVRAKVAAVLACSVLPLTSAAAATRPADPTLLTVSETGKLTLVNLRSGRVRQFMRAYQATWSPDGRRIVFVGRGERGLGDLFVINSDGSHLHRLTHDDSVEEHDPVWSSDGNRLAYFAQRQALFQDDLIVLSLSTGVSASIARGRPLKEQLEWSPDGRKLAFATSSSATRGIRVVDATTGQPVDTWLGNNYPLWSPDGSRVRLDRERTSKTHGREAGWIGRARRLPR